MKKIVCLGDSITDSDRLFSRDGQGNGYVAILDSTLNTPIPRYQVINKGVNGFIVDRLVGNFERDCAAWNPEIVTILIGINDIGILMNTDRTPSQQQELLAKFGRYYRILLEKLKQQTRSKVILMEPFIFPYPQEYDNWIPYVRQMSGQIRDLALEYDCPYLLLHDKLNEAARAKGYDAITMDGIHLTRRGHQLLADTVLPVLLSL